MKEPRNMSIISTQQIEWVPVYRVHGGGHERIGDLDLLVRFHKKQKKTDNSTFDKSFYFTMGEGLVKKIGMEVGDPILLCYNKDDQCSLMLMKHDKGYKIGYESYSKNSHIKVLKVRIPAQWCVLNDIENQKLAYTIDDQNRLLFRIKP